MVFARAVSGLAPFKKKLQFRVSPSASTKKQRTYIMPTGFGWAFGLMNLALFIMAAGYANNLIFIFFFMLLSTGFTSMILANRNMKKLIFKNATGVSLFAEEEGEVVLLAENNSLIQLWQLEATFEKSLGSRLSFFLPAQSEKSLKLAWRAPGRGLQALPRIVFQSYFPFDLFRAWKLFENENLILVFPAKKGQSNFPQESRGSEHIQSTGVFRDHRAYQRGDAVRRIDWKASSRRMDLLVKNFEDHERPALSFTWQQTETLGDFELRVSQLSLWIDQAERQQFQYSLALGSQVLGLEGGATHWRRCLEKLALLKKEDVT